MKKRISHRHAIFVCFISAFLWILSCAVNPVTGKRELMLISENQTRKSFKLMAHIMIQKLQNM